MKGAKGIDFQEEMIREGRWRKTRRIARANLTYQYKYTKLDNKLIRLLTVLMGSHIFLSGRNPSQVIRDSRHKQRGIKASPR